MSIVESTTPHLVAIVLIAADHLDFVLALLLLLVLINAYYLLLRLWVYGVFVYQSIITPTAFKHLTIRSN